MIVGLALITVLSAVIIAVLLLGNPAADAAASATPSASQAPPSSAAASTSTAPTVSPTATAVAAPTAPELPEGLLPAGAVVTVTTEMLRIRSEPGLDGKVVETMSAGDAAYIENAIDAGPVSADGFAWYQVAYAHGRDVWPFQDVAPGGYVTGWMAAGDAAGPYVTLADVSCPQGPLDLDTLASRLTPWERLVCIGTRSVTIEGRAGCDGCGGVVAGASPTWLADLTQLEYVTAEGNSYPAVGFAVPPDGTVPKDHDVVRATLHVDDPAAATCAFDPPSDSTSARYEYDPVAVQVFCRERLVLDSFKVTGHDSFPD
jgi:hypothetical protein